MAIAMVSCAMASYQLRPVRRAISSATSAFEPRHSTMLAR
jgi:hypothetical protein